MSEWIEVMPAYGRDYTNQKSVREDWEAGKDFQETSTRRYVNKQDADNMGLKVIIRYSKLMKVMNVS